LAGHVTDLAQIGRCARNFARWQRLIRSKIAAEAEEMIVLSGALIGAIVGALLASKRKGRALDIAQYAAGFAILFMIIGLFATLFVHRAAL